MTLSTSLPTPRRLICRQQVLVVGRLSLERPGTHLPPRRTPQRGGRRGLLRGTAEYKKSRRLILEYVQTIDARSYIACARMGSRTHSSCHSILQFPWLRFSIGRRRRPMSIEGSRTATDGHHQSTERTGQQARKTIYLAVHHLLGEYERSNSDPLWYFIISNISPIYLLTILSSRSPVLPCMSHGSPDSW